MESSVGYESKQIDNLRENSLNDLYKSSLNYFFKDMNRDQFQEFYTLKELKGALKVNA